MIQLAGITKSFADRILFDNITWQVTDGDRVGLCGPNGAGKTTLLRILAGLDEADRGNVVKPAKLTVGYLPQDGLEHTGRTLAAEAATVFQPLIDARTEIDRIEHALADPALPDGEHETLLVRYHELTEFFRQEEGHSIDLRVTQVLSGLGFSRADFDKPTETFSGGWQMRIALAKLLLGRPTLLLLDEPTNHLDLDARNWLEEYLSAYPFAVILVSHDRFFLDAVVTRIAEISLRTITDYVGTYSHFLIERDTRLELLRKAKHEQDEEIARMRAFIDRFRYQATKAAQVQSRIKMLDKIVPIEVPPERKRVHFTFPACPKSGRMVLELEHTSKSYGGHNVLDRISLHVERGDRIALVAPNGAGKSTLMRMLSGSEAPDTGKRREGHQVVMQYFAQDEANRLPPTKSVYEVMESDSPVGMVPMIRNILGGFLFAGDDIYKRAGVLSGGERTRLAVARMLLRPANTLLLDEPTNHLDLDSKDVLLEALEDFGGTLIFVSHDRYFVDRLATKVIEVGHGAIEVYPGTYEEFLWSKTQRAAAAAAPAPPVRSANRPAQPPAAKPAKAQAPAPTYEEKKKSDTEARKRRRVQDERARRVADLEGRIATREEAIKALEAEMAAPSFYEDRAHAETVIRQHQTLMWEVGDLMNQWEAIQAENPSD
ncbi:MAG TPA: ABC-F family ATP-binding cassette domain-containing protein [Vicinamibacterales bacterium]|nr:ABC-F family ATP-binding cassette domain-containing protein [Vicinamibacterales bacterium]